MTRNGAIRIVRKGCWWSQVACIDVAESQLVSLEVVCLGAELHVIHIAVRCLPQGLRSGVGLLETGLGGRIFETLLYHRV